VTRLANGLQVVLHEDHRTPIAAVSLWYDVGSKDEAPGRSGVAHLFEHVMFQGSKHVAEDSYFRYLEAAGAIGINGTTDTDRTAYFETVPANRLELALWLESDRMGFLLHHVDAQTVAVQRDVIKNERRQSYENAPYGLVGEMIRAAVYPAEHPYHTTAIGRPEELDQATLAEVRTFFQTYYTPRNATLVIAGDIDKSAALALVQKYFGPIPASRPPPRRAVAIPPPEGVTRATRLDVDAGVELARVYMTWPTPAFFAAGDADLDLLARVLTAGTSSRLYKRLVYDLGLAQDVSATQASHELGSLFQIVATAQPGHTADELLAAIDGELTKLRAGGVADDELARARTSTVASRVFEVEKDAARANLLNMYAHYVHEPDYLAKDLARYAAATPASLRDAVTRFLPEDRRVIAAIHPKPGAPVAGVLAKPRGAP
jgi:zinc protease